jgi:hypothetical protein
MIRTVHRRRRLPRSRSTSFYLDRREREASTYCGAPPTDVDVAWRDRNERWTRDDGVEFVPCEECEARR